MRFASEFLVIIYLMSFDGIASGQDDEANYVIKTTWDNKPINEEDQVKFRIFTTQNGDSKELVIEITAPFYDDPPPIGEPGRLDGLWDYEVAEIFFLGKNENYLELEFGPHQHYLAYFLEGIRNVTNPNLLLQPTTTLNRESKIWTTRTVIPQDYLPPDVASFNAYAIHGLESNRVYSALFPNTETNPIQPDFHALKFFKPIDLNNLSSSSINSFIVNYWLPIALLFIVVNNIFM